MTYLKSNQTHTFILMVFSVEEIPSLQPTIFTRGIPTFHFFQKLFELKKLIPCFLFIDVATNKTI